MTHTHKVHRTKKRTTAFDYMFKAHEAFEAGLSGGTIRYQTLRANLDIRGRDWLGHLIETRGLEDEFQKVDDLSALLPTAPLINPLSPSAR